MEITIKIRGKILTDLWGYDVLLLQELEEYNDKLTDDEFWDLYSVGCNMILKDDSSDCMPPIQLLSEWLVNKKTWIKDNKNKSYSDLLVKFYRELF